MIAKCEDLYGHALYVRVDLERRVPVRFITPAEHATATTT
jgi:hypothetical protein